MASEMISGKRGMLPRPYAQMAWPFHWVAASNHWRLGYSTGAGAHVDVISRVVGAEGEQDMGILCGYAFALGLNETSILRQGFISDENYFILTGIGLELVDDQVRGIRPSNGAGAAIAAPGLMPRDTIIRDDLDGKGPLFAKALCRQLALSIRRRDNSECEKYLGPLTFYPAGGGWDQTVSNGVPIVSNLKCFRHPYAMPPKQSQNSDPYVVQFDALPTVNTPAMHVIAVEPVNGMALPPDDNTHVVLDIRVRFHGYFSVDKDGTTPADGFEKNFAMIYRRMMLGAA